MRSRQGFADNHVVVHSDIVDEMHKVERYNFSVYDLNEMLLLLKGTNFHFSLLMDLLTTNHKI